MEELLTYFPYRYVDRSHIFRIDEIDGAMPYILLQGHFSNFQEVGKGTRGHRITAWFSDETGSIECVWFKGLKYVANISTEKKYVIFGKPQPFNGRLNITHPDLEAIKSGDEAEDYEGLMPMYNTTEAMKRAGMTTKTMAKIIESALNAHKAPFAETLPAYLLESQHLTDRNRAIREMHRPTDPERLRRAQYRFKFEELLYLQLYLVRNFKLRQQAQAGFHFPTIGRTFNDYYHLCLKFELTGAQKRVLREIRADVGSGRQMNRLLQGDVGSGKTLVALLTMLMAVDNGFQACLMAPTEILATQHYDNLQADLKRVGVSCALLTGSTRKKERELIAEGLEDGTLKILFGTHALIEPTVKFWNLGMVIIDEQHRFGVKQRSMLWAKNTRPPHVLVMTATPIPRTLAMTVYGDLDVSVIDELPPGRKPVETIHRYDNQREGLVRGMLSQLREGRQVYMVYPLIEENEKMAYRNVEQGFLDTQRAFPDYHVVMVHGKMKAKDKEQAMQRFVKGEAQIMVATTVIEVGVNVPNASVMVIESAERFGLSQLHQLRGRVGRGADQSYCILVTKPNLAEETRKRIEIMCHTTDGFEIAEADMQMRGPGDIDGTQQSGLALDLKVANIARDGQILQASRDIAKQIIDNDPMLEAGDNAILRRRMDVIFAHNVDWGRIS